MPRSSRSSPREHPYAEWLKATQVQLEELPEPSETPAPAPEMPPARPNDIDRAAAPAAGVRLHAGGHSVLPRADGAGRRRSGRLDGHRHAARGAVEQAEAAVQLLQAELRAGHQSADRFDPRGAGDVAGLDDRAAAEPAGPSCRRPLPARGGAADPDQHRSGEGARDLLAGRRRVPHAHDRRDLAGRRGCGRHGAGGRPHLPRGDRCGAGRLQHPDPVGSRRVADAHPDAGAAGDRRGAPPPDPPRPAHQHRAGGGDRRGARGAPFLRAGRLRRGGDQPVSRVRDAGADPRCRTG